MDRETLNALCISSSTALHRFFSSRGVRHDDIDDLIQDSFLRLWAKREKVQPGKARSYLFGIARILVLEYRRGARSPLRFVPPEDLESLARSDPECGGARDHDEDRARMREAVGLLPPRLQEVVRLIHYEELSRQEVAARMGISLNAVYRYDRRAHRRLGQLLGTLARPAGARKEGERDVF